MREAAQAPISPLNDVDAVDELDPGPSVCYLGEGGGIPRYIDVRETGRGNSERELLLCDPLTGLLAYDSFAQHLTAQLSGWIPRGAHLAIGDVDGLKEYVTRSNVADPNLFGHLAGNHCMKVIGSIVLRWIARHGGDWSAIACGTFGGDEVIIATAGGRPKDFFGAIWDLAESIRHDAPRPCSFVCCSVSPTLDAPADPAAFYAKWVGTVDRALFEVKSSSRTEGIVHQVEIGGRP